MMTVAIKPPNLVAMVATFARPEEINSGGRILRIGCLRTPASEIVRQAFSPSWRLIFVLRVQIKPA
jgi:hypothetical protein